MPRRDGDFLFCWTAMMRLLLMLLSVLVAHQAAQAGEGRRFRFRVPRRTCATALVPRRVRQGEDDLVLDQLAHRHVLPGHYAVGALCVRRLGMDLGERCGED